MNINSDNPKKVLVSGPNPSSISEQIKTNARAIINTLKKGELAEKNRRIRKSIRLSNRFKKYY